MSKVCNYGLIILTLSEFEDEEVIILEHIEEKLFVKFWIYQGCNNKNGFLVSNVSLPTLFHQNSLSFLIRFYRSLIISIKLVMNHLRNYFFQKTDYVDFLLRGSGIFFLLGTISWKTLNVLPRDSWMLNWVKC